MNSRTGVMRVTGGMLAGRRLHAPQGETTRPTAARAREGLFGWLGSSVDAARVLDLFAGTGALGIEALSRGAAHALFVERDRAALAALRRNLETLQIGAQTAVLATDVVRAASQLVSQGRRFDLVLMDPPYARVLPDLAKRVQLVGLLDREALLVIERRTRGQDASSSAQEIDGLVHVGSRSYGQTAFDCYERASREEEEPEDE